MADPASSPAWSLVGSIEKLTANARKQQGVFRRSRCVVALLTRWRSSEFTLRNGPCRIDEPDVAKGLGKVAQELTIDGIDLLGKQADVIHERGGAFKDGTGT